MSTLLLLSVLAIIAKYLTDIIKGIIPFRKLGQLDLVPIYALIVGLAMAFLSGIGLLETFGFTVTSKTLDIILTGIAMAGGAEAWHELVAKLRELRGLKE